MHTSRRHPGRASFAGVVVALTLGLVGAGPAAAADDGAADGAPAMSTGVPTADLTAVGSALAFTGHGWGHGRGMGQYGALGYAVTYGWGYRQILDHYYGGTTVGSVGNPEISVELMALTGAPLVVTGGSLTINGAPVPSGVQGLVARLQPNGSVTINAAGACANEGGSIGNYPAGVRISTSNQTSFEGLVRVCEPTGQRAYRGDLSVQSYTPVGGALTQTTFSRLPLQEYLRGVVPRESPDGWGTAGGGKGMQALLAQTVAARSYAMAGGNRPSGAKTCDTTSCQVYGGAARWPASGPSPYLDGPNANVAIDSTLGEVRVMNGTGTVARTEFSSSTGGYTTGGAFPAVVDLGDAVASNPNHTWTATYSTADVAAKLGLPGIRSIDVTGRNGLGDWGGRVTSILVVDSNGASHSYSGTDFRSTMGTSAFKSDWFTIASSARAEAENVVRALYQDVLGRGVDPSGLATWSAFIMANGSPSALVEAIATSRERMEKLVAAQYRLALHREPEPGGLENWVAHLAAGRGVYDLQVGIYASDEALRTLGGGDTLTWVGAMYESILGRPAAASEKQFWADVTRVQGRHAVVAAIARSDEATMRRLTVYYETFLLRGVDPSGRATFLPLMTGRGDFTIPVALGSSPEYWARAQTRTY